MGQAQTVWENYREKNDDLKLYSISQCFNFRGEAQVCKEKSWASKKNLLSLDEHHMVVTLLHWYVGAGLCD